MNYYIADTETAGLKPPPLPASGLVQVAWIKVDENLSILGEAFHEINPGCPIEPGASAVHGKYDQDVAHCPSLDEVLHLEYPATVIGHNCVTGDHEVLTKQGWVKFEDLKDVSIAAAVWQDGKINFAESLVVRQPYEGKLLEYASTYHCGAYTPQHRIIYTRTSKLPKGGSPSWEEAPAEDFATFGSNSVAIPCAGEYELADRGAESLFSENEARLVEAIRADGHVTKNSIRFHFSKPRKVARILKLLQLNCLEYSVDSTNQGTVKISILQSPLRTKIANTLGLGKSKRLGSWVLDLSLAARVAFLDEVKFWGGVSSKGTASKSIRQGAVHSQHSSEIEWIQIAAVLSNRGSRVALTKPNARGFSRSDSKISKATLRNKRRIKILCRPKQVDFNGTVYCLTTYSGAFLVRRNGVVWVTGNCSFDLRFLRPHLAEDVRSICTLALARRYIKGSLNHKLGTLIKHLGLPEEEAHNALGDVKMTRSLLQYLILNHNLALDELSSQQGSQMLHRMPWGKHRSSLLLNLPADYLKWLLSLPDLAPDLRKSVDHFLRIKKL